MIPRPDPYEILGLSPRAEPEVLEAAFRTLNHKYEQPITGDGRILKVVQEAYREIKESEHLRSQNPAIRDGIIIGKYRVMEKISKGGFGRTYKAFHMISQQPVCIKQCAKISPAYEAILLEENKAVWDLRHISIPAMRDYVRFPDGSLGLVMSYIPGIPLNDIIEKIGAIDPETVAWIMERILNALLYLHHEGVVHGDIKPANIIVQPDNHMAVLVDFGLAIVKPTDETRSKGYTEHFAPPEAMRGGPLLPESDMYSLGMTMIYALSGNMADTRAKQIPERVPTQLADFIRRMVRHDVLSRPQADKEEFYREFQKVRLASFGRSRTNMAPIPGLES